MLQLKHLSGLTVKCRQARLARIQIPLANQRPLALPGGAIDLDQWSIHIRRTWVSRAKANQAEPFHRPYGRSGRGPLGYCWRRKEKPNGAKTSRGLQQRGVRSVPSSDGVSIAKGRGVYGKERLSESRGGAGTDEHGSTVTATHPDRRPTAPRL